MAGLTLGFTGTRATPGQEERLTAYLQQAETHLYLSWAFGQYVTGGCRGWDAFVGEFLSLTYPSAIHTVVVPANRSQVDPWWESFDLGKINVVEMRDGTNYKDRNTEIVRRSDQLFYCADYPEKHGKSTRSGTWQTVRIARAAGKTVNGIILNKEKE